MYCKISLNRNTYTATSIENEIGKKNQSNQSNEVYAVRQEKEKEKKITNWLTDQ